MSIALRPAPDRRILPLLLALGLPVAGISGTGSEIRVIPLPNQSPANTIAGDQEAASLDARAATVIQGLRQRLKSPATTGTQTASSARTAASTQPGAAAKNPLSTVTTADPTTRLRIALHAVGTPRELKRVTVARESSGRMRITGAGILQAAVNRSGSGLNGRSDDATVRAFLWQYRDALRLANPDDELQLLWTTTDELDRRHFRFSQRYRGLPVWPAGLTVHLDSGGSVDLMDGSHAPTPRRVPTEALVDGAAAEAAARAAVPHGEQAAVESSALIIYAGVNRPARLAWKLELGVAATARWQVLVDALTARILAVYNKVQTAAVQGSGADLFHNTDLLNLWQNETTYYLLDTSKPMFDSSSNPPNNARGVIQILDARNQPSGDPEKQPLPTLFPVTSSAPDNWNPADAVSAAVNFSTIYDYYYQRHGRNSVDDKGSSIRAAVRLGSNYDNAFWYSDSKIMFFGDGQPFAQALDVTAHEFTHGVTEYTANLNYQDQPGALNEAISDIFGEMTEAYARGQPDWNIGEDLGTIIRSMQNPSALQYASGLPYPSKMSEYVSTTQDNGGVHINSGIINHAYYLLAAGLNGAIGITDAEKIFYRALRYHLTANAQFLDARLACIQSAEELFGANSNQAQKTTAAFDAVEIVENSSGSTSTTTNAPPAAVPLPGEDSVVFFYLEPTTQTYYVGRRETALGDPQVGGRLSLYPAGTPGSPPRNRPSVTADGKLALFVNSRNDICFLSTNQPGSDTCLGLNSIHSAVMSPDGLHYAFLQLDTQGNLDKTVYYYNAETDQAQSFPLAAPASEVGSIQAVLLADAMDISLNNRYLVYDALNVLTLQDNTRIDAWSIYAIDLYTGALLSVIPPVAGFDIGYPALGKASSFLAVFEATDQSNNATFLYAANLLNGEMGSLGQVNAPYAVPVYTGDDRAVVFNASDSSTPTGYSLWELPVKDDHITPAGAAVPYLTDGALGTVYRRNGLTDLRVAKAGKGLGRVTSNFEGIDCGISCSALYPPKTRVILSAQADYGFVFAGWGGVCHGAQRRCRVVIRKKSLVAEAKFRRAASAALRVSVDTRSGSGRVTSLPSGIDCLPTCKTKYFKGAQVTLTALPDAGSTFAGWGGACKGQPGDTCTFTIRGNRRVTARFLAQ